ncbi:MAG: hypothetical protein H0U73_04645 [Tatlockia sp.]|nr:hypothetical protein [Tatlockia sp.]
MNSDNENETIGIIAILIIIIVAALGLFYFFSHRPHAALKGQENNPNIPVPIEAPHPVNNLEQDGFRLIIPTDQLKNTM